MKKALENCPSPSKPSTDHIQDCQEQQRQAMEHLIAHLRQMIASRSDVPFNGALRECNAQRRQLEKAFELYKQAEAKVQVIIAQFGGALS